MPHSAVLLLRVLLPVCLLLLAVGGFSYLKATKSEASPNPPRERVWPVAATTTAPVRIQPTLLTYGEVIAGRRLSITPRVAGPIIEINDTFIDGGVVTAGTTLARIDPFEYEQAAAEREAELAEVTALTGETRAEIGHERQLLAIDERELALRSADLERNESMLNKGTTSTKARDDAAIAQIKAEAAVRGRRQNIDRLERRLEQQIAARQRAEAALARARRDLEDTVIAAPFAGFLDAVTAARGQRVAEGESIGELTDANRLEVRFQLANHHYANLVAAATEGGSPVLGREVAVRWRIGSEALEFNATIARIGARVDADSGGIDLFARLAGSGLDMPLRPGAFVEVAVPDRRYEGVFRLPYRSVVGGSTVYVIEEGELLPRSVEVLREIEDDVLISGELDAGDAVVTTPFPEIGPGSRVSVRDAP